MVDTICHKGIAFPVIIMYNEYVIKQTKGNKYANYNQLPTIKL